MPYSYLKIFDKNALFFYTKNYLHGILVVHSGCMDGNLLTYDEFYPARLQIITAEPTK
jgi:hypothetical protein